MRRPLENAPPSTAYLDRLRVVLVRSRNPLNIGAAARAMSNFGCLTLRLVTPWEPSYLGARAAVGASDVLLNAQLCGSVAEAVADCSLVVGTSAVGERELQHPVHLLPQAAELLRRQLAQAPVAVLFGSEKTGLSNQELSHCHWVLRIPTRRQHISMNLGQAVAVTLYELSRDAASPDAGEAVAAALRGESAEDAASAEVERLTQVLFEALCASGYVHAPSGPIEQDKLRRMVRRLKPNHGDAETLLGMMRQILWKLKREDPAQ